MLIEISIIIGIHQIYQSVTKLLPQQYPLYAQKYLLHSECFFSPYLAHELSSPTNKTNARTPAVPNLDTGSWIINLQKPPLPSKPRCTNFFQEHEKSFPFWTIQISNLAWGPTHGETLPKKCDEIRCIDLHKEPADNFREELVQSKFTGPTLFFMSVRPNFINNDHRK